MLSGTRRKIDALRDIIKQIDDELGLDLIDDLNNDPTVIGERSIPRTGGMHSTFIVLEIMEKWSRLQSLAHEKDDTLKENRKRWKQFRRQLEDLEQAAQYFTSIDFETVPRTVYSKADIHRDQVQRLGEIIVRSLDPRSNDLRR